MSVGGGRRLRECFVSPGADSASPSVSPNCQRGIHSCSISTTEPDARARSGIPPFPSLDSMADSVNSDAHVRKRDRVQVRSK